MSTQSFIISGTVSFTPNVTVLRASVDAPKDDSLEILGTFLNPDFQPELTVEPGDPLEPGETTEPSYINPSPDTFNPLALGRLTNAPSTVFNLSVDSITISINGQDFSSALYSFDWATPISGVSQGSATLIQTVGLDLDPETSGISQGSTVLIRVNGDLVANCYVIGSPSYDLDGNGQYNLVLELGDELSLLSNTTRNRTKYCGLPPTNTQQLATIYANLNGLRTRTFPVGHDIVETSINNFLTESPYEFLSAIYSPINRDVRTNAQGSIIFPIRPSYDPATAKVVNYRQVIESQNRFSQFFEPYTKVKASNDFTIELPFDFFRRSTTTIQGNPENTKPWFQGGYQETVTTITSYGDTDIHILEEVFGYVPLESLPWAKELVDEDPCAIGGFTTEWDVISRKITALTYYDHPSGVKVVSKEETWVNGLEIYQIQDEGDPDFEDYQLFNGLQSYSIITYQNTPQVNLSVCEKDYTLVITKERSEEYGLNETRDFVFKSWSESSYTPSGVSSLLGQEAFTGVEQSWVESINSGEFNEAENIWIIQPTQTNTGVNPPSSKIIKAVTQDVTNFSEFTLMAGDVEPTPINAPFCYNRPQLNTISERYLRQQYGLSYAKVITVPWAFVLELGESVQFTDRDGRDKTYLVWNKEINCTENQVTKSYVLLRNYDG